MTVVPTSAAAPATLSAATETCDVFVIGGGPGGSTAAALLATQGRKVVVVEKTHHPRFHIGESLLPANVALFDRLGVRDQVEKIGMPKWGVEFVSMEHQHRSYLEFADAWDKTMPYAWQVRRSVLDELLFRHAATRGATTLEGCQVRDVQFDADGVTVQARLEDGTERRWRARFLLDASGRDTFLANKYRTKVKNPKHNSSAIFGHYTNAQRLEGRKEGNISIFWFPHGWFWFIPLADGTTSVGAVCWPYYLKSRDKPMRQFWEDTVASCPPLAERLKNAQLVDEKVHATGNYSYTGTQCSGERYLILGDAFTFIDPVFSSGLYLAMHSAFDAAEVTATCLDRPAEAANARRRYEATMRKGPREFSWFISRVTNPTMREFFMYPRNPMRVKEALLSVLAGDIYGKTPIWTSLYILKALYYAVSLQHLPRAWKAWRAHRRNVRDAGALKGETIMEVR